MPKNLNPLPAVFGGMRPPRKSIRALSSGDVDAALQLQSRRPKIEVPVIASAGPSAAGDINSNTGGRGPTVRA